MDLIYAVVAQMGRIVCREGVRCFFSLVGLGIVLLGIAIILLGVDALINLVF